MAENIALDRGSVVTGLTGNEMYCIDILGYHPGNLLVGNSVYSRGLIGTFTSGFRSMVGGEITPVTETISEGRHLAMARLNEEMKQSNGHGATGVSSEVIFHASNIEFLSIASTIHQKEGEPTSTFTTAADGQELYCQIDAGYAPISFVMGNVAYAIGLARGVGGMFKQMVRGEVHQYSDIFQTTRDLALQRIVAEAEAVGANAVIGIKTNILPFQGTVIQEMLMVGTASRQEIQNDAIINHGCITSDLTAEEMWGLARIGYTPMQLVLGTSVYSLGLVGGIVASLKNLVKGEISEMTELIYSAREQSLSKVKQQATDIGADDVVGVRTYIYDLGGGMIEFLAIGTAVKRTDAITTKSDQLVPQAIIRDKDTFINTAELSYGTTITSRPTS
jgi:uncharacterized protein YbjQ (UPF0145 family)